MHYLSSKSTSGNLIPLLLIGRKSGLLLWYNKKYIWSLSPVPTIAPKTLGISLLIGENFVIHREQGLDQTGF